MTDENLPTYDDVVRARVSCRAYAPTPVPAGTLDDIFTLAQRTPTWCNAQPWRVLLAEGDALAALRAALYAHAEGGTPAPDLPFPARYEGVYLDRRRGAGFGLYSALGIAREDRAGRDVQMAENFRFFGAPQVALVFTPVALGTYGAVDCGAYANSLALAATSRGVASIIQAAPALYADFVRDYLGVDDDWVFVCTVAFGYPAPGHPAATFTPVRAEIAAVVEHVTLPATAG
jgi:nitroreductase